MKKKLCSLLIAICLFAFVLLSFAACASSDLKYEAMYGDDSYWWSVSGSYGDSTCCFLIGFFALFSSERRVCSFVSDLSQNVEFFQRIGTGKFKNLSNQLGVDYGRSVFVPHIGDGKSFSEAVVC